MNTDLIKMVVSLFCGLLIGLERESQQKSAGLRTITFITFGATLITIFSLRYLKITETFDTIRAIAYYLVAIGLGGGIIYRNTKKEVEGVTTSVLFFPMSVIGFFCGIADFGIAIISTFIIFLILMLKYVKIKLFLKFNGRKKERKQND